MTKYTTSVNTPFKPEAAFDYLADVRHFAEWDPGVRRVDAPPGQIPALRATYDIEVKTGPTSMTLRYEVVEFEPPRRLVLRAQTRTLLSLDEIRVEPHGAGARVTYEAELTGLGLGRLAAPLLAVVFPSIGDRAAAGLAHALDGKIAVDA